MGIKIKHYPLIIAHRGYRARYPENTLAAFAGAVQAGVPMIELDITLTCDRCMVVIHDDTLDRTTNGTGLVSGQTLAEIQALDAGSWFDPCFAGERVPTLAAVFAAMPRQLLINVEIKASAFEAHPPADAIETQLVKSIQAAGREATVLVSSFHPGFLRRIARMPRPPSLALLTEDEGTDQTLALCRQLELFAWHPHHRRLSRDRVEQFRRAGLRVFAYTVNRRQAFERLIAMGADGVFTDDPLALG